MTIARLQPRLATTLHFSPRLQHAVRLLQMSTPDYAQALRAAALDNPFLEVETPESPGGVDDAAPAAGTGSPTGIALDIEVAPKFDRQTPHDPLAGRHLPHDASRDLLQQTPVRMSLAAHLRAQLCTLRLERRERMLAELVIEALDDDGYLRVTLAELAAGLAEDDAGAPAELELALRCVQGLDPAGVAARDVAECLALQLRDVADPALRALALRIVREQLDLLATRRLARLAAQLEVPLAATHAAVERILRLDPRPGACYTDTPTQTLVPDVIARKVGGIWTTTLNEQALPRVRLHQSYAVLFERCRAQGDGAMQDCLEQARWTVRNASQRMSTILSIATAIVARQMLFLDHGHLAMKPLGLREIADAVGVHPSTVSRAVRHKYLATPHGVLEMHRFFSRGMAHRSGGASAPAALQELIRELIEAEAPESRLSDAELARELERQGFLIARRTVTKYRQHLHIEAVERRRSH